MAHRAAVCTALPLSNATSKVVMAAEEMVEETTVKEMHGTSTQNNMPLTTNTVMYMYELILRNIKTSTLWNCISMASMYAKRASIHTNGVKEVETAITT